MTIRLVDLFVECPHCRRRFSRFDPNRIDLKVTLDDIHSDEWTYCSTGCMEAKLENVNWDKFEIPIRIMSKDKVSSSPDLWVIVCKTDLKVEIL